MRRDEGTMGVGVGRLVVVRDAFNHGSGYLCSGRTVNENQWFVVVLALQGWKKAANGRGGDSRHRHI